ncbi:sugar phosphate isomerase/epimerase family protein [Pseudarthrobacter phenanthrenivorans]|uniref:sugar phosphate isomerase/epimerase family protein n=1 Tax=Pseudarthrobacter phenanthrenivorans TaxID=361575 RepID=UPI00344F0C05
MPAEHTLEEFAQQVRDRFGLDAVELCQIQFDESSPERVDRLKSSLDNAGVRVLTVPIDVGDLSSDNAGHREEDVAAITRWLDIAQALGARYVRVNTGTPHANGPSDNIDGLVTALSTLADASRRRGLELLIENHGGASSDPEYLLEVQRRVGSDKVGILLDLGNFEPVNQVSMARMLGTEVDDMNIDTEPVYERIARLAPVASLVHAKAYDPRSDGSPLLDLDRALGVVAAAGYAGSISIEWEGQQGDPWIRTQETLDAVRRAFPVLAGALQSA